MRMLFAPHDWLSNIYRRLSTANKIFFYSDRFKKKIDYDLINDDISGEKDFLARIFFVGVGFSSISQKLIVITISSFIEGTIRLMSATNFDKIELAMG